MKTALQAGGRKDTQRERLLSAVVDVAAQRGYADATVARIIARAGVSRPTFYKYFPSKDACFLAALEQIETRLLAAVDLEIGGLAPEHAISGAVRAISAFANAEPTMARVLMNESLTGGPPTLDARDRVVTAIARLLGRAHQRARPSVPLPDISSEALIGAVFRLLAPRLRCREQNLTALTEELVTWVDSYRTPFGEHRWSSLTPMPAPARSPFLADTPRRAPPPLPPGRPRRSSSAVAENHRQRILFATAEAIYAKGFLATSVTDIIGLAGVDGRAFYRLFTDKRSALAAVHEESFQQLMAVTAGAFFAGEQWPERIWEAGRAFTQHLEQNPTLLRASLIESHAGGPLAAQRTLDLIEAFTIFLQEGYRYETHERGPSAVALEAVAQTIYEIVYRRVRVPSTSKISGLLAHATHICVTPFVGATRAGELIDRLTSGAGQPARAPRPARGKERDR